VPRAPLPPRGVTTLRETLPHLLGRHYPAFIAPTGSCAKPTPSSRLGSGPRTHGLRRLLPAPAGHRPFPTFSLPIFPCVSGPIPRLPLECLRPLLPLGHWPSPANERVGVFFVFLRYPNSYFSWGGFSELQSFLYVQTRKFARHSGSSYPFPCGFRQPWLLRPPISRLVTCPVLRIC
jgi:hypothetical protein